MIPSEKLEKMPSEYSPDKIQLLKNTVCKGSSDNEFQLFLHICKRTGLDPFAKQIYAIKRKERQQDGSYRENMTIQTGIDGYRLVAERTGKYAPGREPVFNYDVNGKLISSTAYIKKQTQDGTWHEVAATAFYSEYVQTYKDKHTNADIPTKFWLKMAHTMTAKCAEALALRKAFPDLFSGVYTNEEMMQAEVEPVEVLRSADELLTEFLVQFNEIDQPWVKTYIEKYAAHFKLTIEKTLEANKDHEKFMIQFEKWRLNEQAKLISEQMA